MYSEIPFLLKTVLIFYCEYEFLKEVPRNIVMSGPWDWCYGWEGNVFHALLDCLDFIKITVCITFVIEK